MEDVSSVLAIAGRHEACAHVRLVSPLKAPDQGRGRCHACFLNEQAPTRKDMRETDVLVLGRLWRRRYLRYLEYARSHRKPVIYDIDDDSLGIPEGHEDYPRFQKPRVRKAIERFIADADAVTVSTPELAAKLSESPRMASNS